MVIRSYTIKDSSGNTAEIVDYGAALRSLSVKGRDIVLGFEDNGDYIKNGGCLGAVVGPNANRIGEAAFEINGKRYELEKNDGENNLHSGAGGFQYRTWELKEQKEDTVTFEITSPEGDCGFPGNLICLVTYTIKDGALIIDYEGSSDADTVFNLTNHAYFNLDGHDHGSIHDHKLKLNAKRFVCGGKDAIPHGEYRMTSGTPMDFAEYHTLGERINEECAAVYREFYGRSACRKGWIPLYIPKRGGAGNPVLSKCGEC